MKRTSAYVHAWAWTSKIYEQYPWLKCPIISVLIRLYYVLCIYDGFD